VYVTVPAFQWLWSREDLESGHSRRYTLKTLSRVLEASGFTLEFGTYFFSFLPPAILFGRTIAYRLGIRGGGLSVEQIRSEHTPGNSSVRSLVKILTDRELSRLAEGHRLRWGASCLAVARKTPGRLPEVARS
jgi:hypothetical protein